MLTSLSDLGYEVEWRVVNAADYGYPQKRRRIFIVGRSATSTDRPWDVVTASGTLARALPATRDLTTAAAEFRLGSGAPGDDVMAGITRLHGATPFRNAGLMRDRDVWTTDVTPRWAGRRLTLGDILEPHDAVADRYLIPDAQLPAWRYLKGAKREQRLHHATGTPYRYVEGPLPFPDRTDQPARTILTAEGGATPSRFKHVVATGDGRFRRLTPRELERLNGFPDDWTATGMPEGRRAFMMGNALVIGLVERIGSAVLDELAGSNDAATLRDEAPAVAS